MRPCMIVRCSGSCEVDHRRNNGRDDNPEELNPVEERDARELWISIVIERRPECEDKRDEEQQKEPGTALSFRSTSHKMFSFV